MLTMNAVEYCRSSIAGAIVVPHSGDLVSWADGKLRIPYSTRYPIFISTESPWLLEPMRAITDPRIRRVDVRMPAGAAKSLIGELLIAYCIDQHPGLLYYVWQTDDDAKDAMEDRIMPMIEANKFLVSRLPVDRNKKRSLKIAFPHMSLYAVGANPSAAQSKRVKTLIMEEPHLYQPGMQTAMEARTNGVKAAKIITLSTGSVVDDESDRRFNEGSVEEWQVACPHCGQFQIMTDNRDRLRADIGPDTVNENGEHDWKRILPTVRYNCEACGMDWPTDDAFRKQQAQTARYIATNPNAPEDHRSFHLEAVAVHYFPLGVELMKKLQAVSAYKRGSIEAFREYMQKSRAMAWDESPTGTDEDASFERQKGAYLKRELFEGEITRFMCVDNQAGKASKGQGAHRWFECRAFGPMESRLIDEGRITTWEEVEEMRIALGVDPQRVLVDCAWDSVAVQEVLVRYGWQGLWGDPTDKKSFPHHEDIVVNGKVERIVRQYPFSRPQVGHVGLGKNGVRRQARYFFWCQRPIKDMWHRLRDGLGEYRWTVPQDISDEYKKQTSVEFKRQQFVKGGGKRWEWFVSKGKDNHLTDCSQMCLVAAVMDSRLREILWSGPQPADGQNNEQEKATT